MTKVPRRNKNLLDLNLKNNESTPFTIFWILILKSNVIKNVVPSPVSCITYVNFGKNSSKVQIIKVIEQENFKKSELYWGLYLKKDKMKACLLPFDCKMCSSEFDSPGFNWSVSYVWLSSLDKLTSVCQLLRYSLIFFFNMDLCYATSPDCSIWKMIVWWHSLIKNNNGTLVYMKVVAELLIPAKLKFCLCFLVQILSM